MRAASSDKQIKSIVDEMDCLLNKKKKLEKNLSDTMDLLTDNYFDEFMTRMRRGEKVDVIALASIEEQNKIKSLQNEIHLIEQEYTMSPEEMRVVIVAKQAKRVSQGKDNFECKVFSRSEEDQLALKNYVNALSKDPKYCNQRVQIIVETECSPNHGHWSAMDVLVKENELEILHYDQFSNTGSGGGGANTDKVAKILAESNAQKPVTMVDAGLIVNTSRGKRSIQNDTDSCSIFALSSALNMSKEKNLHDLCTDTEKVTLAADSTKGVLRKKMSAIELPALLLKNAQSRDIIQQYEQHRLSTKDLETQEKKSLSDITSKRMVGTANRGILLTREKYKALAHEQDKSTSTVVPVYKQALSNIKQTFKTQDLSAPLADNAENTPNKKM